MNVGVLAADTWSNVISAMLAYGSPGLAAGSASTQR
jgi:hypothetical protein